METTLFNKLLLGFTAGAHLVLGTVVYRKNPFSLLNRLVMGYTYNLCIWALVVLMILFQTEYESLLLWVRISHAVAAFGPWFVLALVYCFREENYPTRLLIGLLLFSIALSALSMTPLMISGIDVPIEQKDPLYGPLFPLYTLFFSGAMGYGVYFLFRQLHKVRGIARYQIRYFIGGIIISFVLGSLSNLFLPLFGIMTLDLRPYGATFTLIMVASITYAIVKYRLMDIHMALRKVLVYALSTIAMGGALALPLWFLVSRPTFPDPPSFLMLIFLAMIAAIFFQPLKELIRTTVVDRYIYRGTYDYYDALREANKAVVSILNLEELLDFLVTKVVETAQIQKGTFYLRVGHYGYFRAKAMKVLQPAPLQSMPDYLEAGDPLVEYMERGDDVLLRSDLRHNRSPLEQDVVSTLAKIGGEAVVPVTTGRDLEGIFVLGPKLSGEPYSIEDVSMLSTLASQLAVALKNAQSHREVAGMKQYLENVLENMGNGLLTVDAGGRILTFNSAAEEIIGLEAEKVMGKKAEEVLHGELALLLEQTLFQGRGIGEVEFEVQVGDSWRFVCCSTALVKLSEKEERGVIMVMSDTTRLKELEREKSRTERLASLGELAAGIAHEIKNPLVSIKTFAELLPEKYEDYNFRCSFSHIVGEEIDRINNLVTELLGFARNSSQSFLNVEVEEVLEEILLLLAPQLESHGVEVEKHYEPSLPCVQVDRHQFKQALFNICQNAVEAMTGGGKLAIKVKGEPGAVTGAVNREEMGINSAKKAYGVGKIRILIEDTGEGISSEKKEKVFDPFYTTKDYGVGIGLSISHRILTDCGGTVQLQSTEGKGTSFEILLPASPLQEGRKKHPIDGPN